MKNKMPKLFIQTGRDARDLRQKMGRNQLEFWKPLGVTQSGGSRYESGRDMPRPVQMLLHLAYAPEKQAKAMMEYLRGQEE